jgi:pyruvate formate lyase activating enzyme
MPNDQPEAILYAPAKDGAVTCGVCPRRCRIAPGGRGTCEARVNIDGKLRTVTYGLCSSVAVDPIEKKPVFHFHPGTLVLSVGSVGCNFRCKHCQNFNISMASTEDGSELNYIGPVELVALAMRERCQGIAWTYNEPTIWLEYVLDGAKLAREAGLYTVMVTNGYITPEGLDALGPYMDVWRVDVKGFTDETYRYLAGIPHVKPVLEGAERAKHHWHMHVEVVTNVIPTVNDDDEQLEGIARWMAEKLGPETPWHVTRFIPYLELSHLQPTPASTLERALEIGRAAGLKYVYVGNLAGHPAENTFCPSCGELLIERTGYRVAKKAMDAGACAACGTSVPIVS